MRTTIEVLSACIVLALTWAPSLSMAQSAPANDNFVNAAAIQALPFSTSESVLFATSEGADPNTCSSTSNSVWFSFTAPRDMVLVADTLGSSYDSLLSVHQGSFGDLTRLACNDDASGTQQSEVVFHAAAGQTYYFLAALKSSEEEPILVFNLSEGAPVPNDLASAATPVTALPFLASQQTGGATTSTDDPGCTESPNSVWFKFNAPRDMRIEANTFGSDFDTTLSAYAGSPVQSALVACNDNDGNEQSRVSFNAKQGTTYYFMAAGVPLSPSGNLTFTLLDAGVPIPPFLYAINIDRVGTTAPGVGARLHGTAVCNKTSAIPMSVFLRQEVRSTQREGFTFAEVNCVARQRVRWSLPIAPFEGNFVPFAFAKAELESSVCDPEDPNACQSKTVNRNVLLLPAPRR